MTEADTIKRPRDASLRREERERESKQPTSETNPIVWSVNAGGATVVNLTHTELVERVRSGRLPVTAFLWRDGMEDWKALEQFPEFESLVAEFRVSDSGLRPKPEESTHTATDAVGSDATPPHIGTKDDAFLAVYARPLATLEFATAMDGIDVNAREDDLPSDALTPTNPSPLRARRQPPRPRKEPAPITKVGLAPITRKPETEPEPLRSDEVVPAARPALAAVRGVEAVGPTPIGPPRPVIAALPPIIVRELPLSGSELVAKPAPAPLDEATLVLGRKRTHRWVPLRAAIVSAFGSACLASVMTWLIVRPARPVLAVEPRAESANTAPGVSTPPPASDPAATEPAALAQGSPAEVTTPSTAVEPARPKNGDGASDADRSTTNASARGESKTGPTARDENAGSVANASDTVEGDAWQGQDPDPGLREAAKPATKSASATTPARPSPQARAGWPSNPGF